MSRRVSHALTAAAVFAAATAVWLFGFADGPLSQRDIAWGIALVAITAAMALIVWWLIATSAHPATLLRGASAGALIGASAFALWAVAAASFNDPIALSIVLGVLVFAAGPVAAAAGAMLGMLAVAAINAAELIRRKPPLH